MQPVVKTPIIEEPATPVYRRHEERIPEEFHEKPFKPEEQPVDSYELEYQHPLILDCFGIDPIDYVGDAGGKDKLDVVDRFIKEEIRINHYKANVKTYKRVLEAIKRKIGITVDFEQNEALERLHGFIMAYETIKEGQDEKLRRQTLNELYKSIKKKDFNSEEMELRLVEDYLRERNWNGDTSG